MGLCFSDGGNANDTAVAVATLEVNNAVGKSIERVIATHAYVSTGIMNSTALTYDDVACNAGLTTPNLNA